MDMVEVPHMATCRVSPPPSGTFVDSEEAACQPSRTRVCHREIYKAGLRAGWGCGEKSLGEWVVGKLPFLLLWLPNPFFFVFLAQEMIEHVVHS